MEFKERESNPCIVDCSFHLCVVKHSSIEDNPKDDSIETEIPKVFLKVQTLIEFDTFVATHGPFTAIDGKHLIGYLLNESYMVQSTSIPKYTPIIEIY